MKIAAIIVLISEAHALQHHDIWRAGLIGFTVVVLVDVVENLGRQRPR